MVRHRRQNRQASSPILLDFVTEPIELWKTCSRMLRYQFSARVGIICERSGASCHFSLHPWTLNWPSESNVNLGLDLVCNRRWILIWSNLNNSRANFQITSSLEDIFELPMGVWCPEYVLKQLVVLRTYLFSAFNSNLCLSKIMNPELSFRNSEFASFCLICQSWSWVMLQRWRSISSWNEIRPIKLVAIRSIIPLSLCGRRFANLNSKISPSANQAESSEWNEMPSVRNMTEIEGCESKAFGRFEIRRRIMSQSNQNDPVTEFDSS
jgi:hypothetical protein